MTITCEKCSTRFVLDDARIPAQGARVRCQHRFHVKPPPVRASPHEIAAKAVEHSAPFDSESGREPPAATREKPAAAAREKDGDGALDNPEFLFEEPAPEPAPRVPQDAPPEPPAPTPVPEAVREEPVAAPAAPEAEAGDRGLFGSLPDTGFGEPDTANTAELTRAAWETQGVPPEGPSGETIGRPDPAGYEVGESEPPLGDVDPGTARPPSRGVRVSAWQGYARDELGKLELDERRRESATSTAAEPAPPRASRAAVARSLAPRAAASLLAVGLLAASARVLHQSWLASFAPPRQVRGAGWIASDIEAFPARGAAGQPVLVLRGSLAAEGSAPPPRVRALLLDGAGRPLGEGVDALARRLDDSELDAAAIASALAGAAPAAERPVRGFTALIPLAPDAAERYRLELLPAPGDAAR
jgi:predicted Zn finger-like uncharacterized protein